MEKVSKYAAAVILAMSVSPLWAADLPVKARQAAVAPLSVFDPYSGFYLGGELGYGWNLGNVGLLLPGGIPADLGALSAAPQGVIGGAFVGWGTRIPGFLSPLGLDGYFGIEGNGDFGSLKTAGAPITMAPGSGIVVNPSEDWLASARARFGLIYQNVMFYGTAGWGWAGSGITATTVVANTAVASNSNSGTMSGFTWGGGIEFPWFFGNGWKARLQYLQYDLGTIDVCQFSGSCSANGGMTLSNKDRIDTITAGISYKF